MRGIYLLFVVVKKDVEIKIGKLGTMVFKRGKYIYVGSAQKSLEARVGRHLSKNKKLHWYIDYLLDNSNVYIDPVYYKLTNKKSDESKYACLLSKNNPVIPKFGSSDSKCKSHLIIVQKSNCIDVILKDAWHIFDV